MKIAVDCRMMGKSGIGTYIDNILIHLILDNPQLSFLLIGDKLKLNCYSNNNNCKILHTDIPILSLKELFYFPIKEINRCDLFYSPNYNLPIGIKIPVLCTIHDVIFLDIKGLTSKFGKFAQWLMLWRAIKKSKKIFTVSNFSKERILFHFKCKKEIIVTHNGIQKNLQEFIVPIVSPFNFPYIIFIGNIKKHKGIQVLLDAYNKVSCDGFTHKLVIVGSYKNFKTKDNTVIKLLKNKNNNIIFTDHITNNQLYNILAHASLLIQPSTYEGFGIPPLEGLYLGCKALISDIPVFREIYGNLPVAFFEVNNVDDLVDKMKSIINNTTQINIRKCDIDQLYNFKKSAAIIFKEFENVE